MIDIQESKYSKRKRQICQFPFVCISMIKHMVYILFSSKRISWNKSYLISTAFEIHKSNFLNIKNSLLKKCSFIARGDKNLIQISGKLLNVDIIVQGENNRVVIDNVKVIQNTKIIIKGNNCRINVGRNTTINGAQLVCMGNDNKLDIGNDCLFAQNINIWATDSHPIFHIDNTNTPINNSKPIIIEDHVWIGENSCILKGVHLGKNSIIGMGSVVTHDTPANTISCGNPARVISENKTWVNETITI